MNAGWMLSPVRFSKLFLAAVLLSPACALAGDWDIDQLMQSLAKNKSGRATFVEKKHIALLDTPVQSSGELSYVAPGRIEKHTIKPRAESMVIDGDVMYIERGRQKLTVQLPDYPELAGFIDSLRGTLAGDRKMLERMFRLKLEGSEAKWTLMLWPTMAKMANNIHLIRITGSHDDVRNIDLIQTDGDRTVTAITRVAPG